MPVEPPRPPRLPSTVLGWAIAALVLVSMAAFTAWQIASKPAQNPGPPVPTVSLTSPVAAAARRPSTAGPASTASPTAAPARAHILSR